MVRFGVPPVDGSRILVNRGALWMSEAQPGPGRRALARRLLQVLRKETPSFHGREHAGARNYAIQMPVLTWIVNTVSPGSTSLETGCGYSTVILAALSDRHTAISPFSEEHSAIRKWCHRHGMDMQHVEFIARSSQEALPELAPRELDLVLIDGDHAFPAPFIDWYYTADQLSVGGHVIVDDTQIPTGRILQDFLTQESERWERTKEFARTAIFVRTTESRVAKGIGWIEQPFCRVPKKALSGLTHAARLVQRLKGKPRDTSAS